MQFYDSQEMSNQQNETLARYTAKTYLWMFLGLVISFAAAYGFMISGLYLSMLMNDTIIFLLCLVEIILVMVLAARIKKMSVAGATIMFLLYALINGITLTSLFYVFEISSLIWIFAATAGMFGIMGAWGYFTKQDLSGWRKVLMFGLIGLIIMGVLGLFLNLGSLDLIVCLVGVAVFLGFTAYDTQKIKALYHFYESDPVMLRKASIFSALQLYLDFINLFLYLLRLFGRRK